MRRLLKNKRYRWEKDKIDVRDYRYQPTQISSLPKIVDLTKKLPMVYNQGRLGSCTANALYAAMYKSGFTYEDIVLSCSEKIEVLKNRKWIIREDGLYQHIK